MSTTQIEVINTSNEHADALAAFQHLCYPGLPDHELFTAAHYANHIRVFPEGQFVAIAKLNQTIQVVAATTTMRTSVETLPAHFLDLIGHNTLDTHDPGGIWLYGVDMSVLPAYRGLGISRRLYDARAALVQRLNLRGEMVAGLIPGYQALRARMTVEDYVAQVVSGTLSDPTLTPQLKAGFRVERLLYGYVNDARSDHVCTLLFRDNPTYQPGIPTWT